MLSGVYTAGISGISGYLIKAECDISDGLPSFEIVGLGDTAVKESKERIKSAVKYSESDLYKKRIIVNLAPASLKKEGSMYDFPIALAIMGSEEKMNREMLRSSVFIGELSLDGSLRSVSGILPIAISSYEQGIKNIFVPYENAKEASIVSGLNVYPVKHLTDALFFLSGKKELHKYEPVKEDKDELFSSIDFSDVKGQDNIKRALLVASAGNHNFLMLGSPGSGKTMIAERIPTILPPLSFEESLEVSKIYSVAGLLNKNEPLITKRPFRQIHHTISSVGITGGGPNLKPGEISLAHFGVLFLDEMPEFRKDSLEALRQPVEDGEVTITRASGSATYPSSFMLVASLNPCPCGYYGSKVKECTCTDAQIKKYMKKISGPLLDRIDIQIEVPSVKYKDLSGEKSEISSKVMLDKVMKARDIQLNRYKNESFNYNKDIPPALLSKYCYLKEPEKKLMENAYNKLGLSARAHSRILKVARTIADIEGEKNISGIHLAEAIQYRSLDKKYF